MIKTIAVIIKPNFNQQLGHNNVGEEVATVGWKIEADREIYGDYIEVDNTLDAVGKAVPKIVERLRKEVYNLLDEGVKWAYVEETPEMRAEAARTAAAIEVKIVEEERRSEQIH